MKLTNPGNPVEILQANLSLKDYCDQKTYTQISKDTENAFFGCDLTCIVDRYERWMDNLPRVKPFYAVKCNPDHVVLRTLANLGANFDCASKSEIKTILDMGISPDRIIFANPCKQSSHIVYAREHGIQIMTFDNMEELRKIKRIFPDAKLLLRILPKSFKSQCNLGIKFGCHMKESGLLLQTAKDLNLNIIGASFHVGSGCYEPAAFPTAIAMVRNIFDQAQILGFEPYLLDIGGGYPGTDDTPLKFEQFCVAINDALANHFPKSSGVEVIAEPGRYFATSAFTLVTNIIAKRTVSSNALETSEGVCNTPAPTKNDCKRAFMYYINDGVYGSFNCLLYDHVAECPPMLFEKRSDETQYACSIWGPTCDVIDCVTKFVKLPELDIGDWVYFENMGAYTMSAATTFNGMQKPCIFYVVDEKYLKLVNGIDPTNMKEMKLVIKRTAFDEVVLGGVLTSILNM